MTGSVKVSTTGQTAPETAADALGSGKPVTSDASAAEPAGHRKARETAAERRARPSALDIAVATAERFGVCVRPVPMMVVDTETGAVSYEAAPCNNSLESVCPSCAAKKKALRQQQAREGWHLEAEPVPDKLPPTEHQHALLTARADLVAAYRDAVRENLIDDAAALRGDVEAIDTELRESGMRGTLPPLDPPLRAAVKRSTKRRQDAPDLPRLKVESRTVGEVFGGKFQPSMFVTLTLPSYGPVSDGAPRDADSYDYCAAARDAVHFPALVDRWIQNLRRAVGWNVQYFATVEPQKRGAPHLHIALRGAIPHKLIRAVTAATYHQVWWPNHDQLVYPDAGGKLPVWSPAAGTFCDPETGLQLTSWDDAIAELDDDAAEPAHVVRFGTQVNSQGLLAGTPDANRRIGYLTKYLTKAVSEVLDAENSRQKGHYARLHTELAVTPCSERCPVWLRYGIVPKGASEKTAPGKCRGKAHRRETLGVPGRRVLVSRLWSGKTLPDHRAERGEFVRQTLAAAGITKTETDRDRFVWSPVQPGDRGVPKREALMMAAIAQRTVWSAEYDRARILLSENPPGSDSSANRIAA